jgi:hypothetical protein
MRGISPLIALVFLATTASAQDRQGGMMGAGSAACSEYTQQYASEPDTANNVYYSWAQGYMSGQNIERSSQKKPMRNLAALPIATQLDFLRRYCLQSPTSLFAVAAQNLFNALPTISR